MSYKNSLIRKVVKELGTSIERVKIEFEPSYGEIIGALEILKQGVFEQVNVTRYMEDTPEDEEEESNEIESILRGESPEEDVGDALVELAPLEVAASEKADLQVFYGDEDDEEEDTVESLQELIIEELEKSVSDKDKTIDALRDIINELDPEILKDL